MIASPEIRLANPSDAWDIAILSKKEIECGLGWGWTEHRVRRSILDRSTNAIVALVGGVLAGFAIMKYGDDRAHLVLLGVNPEYRRRGIGAALLSWLENTLTIAGIRCVQVEVRETNRVAQAFYLSLGYEQVNATRGYYRGREAAIHLVKEVFSGNT